VATEVDGYDEAGEASREADKLTQMEARLKAYGSEAREYLECTVSIEQGRIWQEYWNGSRSRIALPCPHCGEGVTPEREHLRGWEDAEHEVEAEARSAWHCPECGKAWSEDERAEANRRGVLVHRGQTVRKARRGLVVEGDLPPTRTLGFRWSAVNNLFRSAGVTGLDCWKAERNEDADNAERYLCQFVFATPYIPPIEDTTPLDPHVLQRRMNEWPRGLCPHDTTHIAMGIDVGKYQLHWAVPCWRAGRLGHLMDYGSTSVPSHDMDEDLAILTALRELAVSIREGWAMESAAKPLRPQIVLIDAGYKPEVVYQFCREAGKPFYPSRGHSTLKRWKTMGAYAEPKDRNKTTKHVGDAYHLVQMKQKGVTLWHVNADHWKTWVHRRLRTPKGDVGSLGFFSVKERYYHMDLVKSLTAEKQVEEFVPGKGTIIRWEVVRRNKSHWLDALGYACVGLHFAGARLTEAEPRGKKQVPKPAVPQGGGMRTRY
jgi:phage terminase large subunit GpA-like protein